MLTWDSMNSSNISIGAAPLLIGELAYPQHRGRLVTMYNTLWYVGSIIAAWTVYGTIKYHGNVAWRIPVALQALMPVLQLAGIFLLPESPRWLCAQERDNEALEILIKVRVGYLLLWHLEDTLTVFPKYHASENRDDSFVHAELSEIRSTIQLERRHENQGWTQLVKTPGNRKRLLLICLTSFFSQCSGNGLVSYYIHDILTSVGVTDPESQSLFNGGLQIWSWLVALVFSVMLVDRWGRKTLFMIAAVGMLVTFSIWTG